MNLIWQYSRHIVWWHYVATLSSKFQFLKCNEHSGMCSLHYGSRFSFEVRCVLAKLILFNFFCTSSLKYSTNTFILGSCDHKNATFSNMFFIEVRFVLTHPPIRVSAPINPPVTAPAPTPATAVAPTIPVVAPMVVPVATLLPL